MLCGFYNKGINENDHSGIYQKKKKKTLHYWAQVVGHRISLHFSICNYPVLPGLFISPMYGLVLWISIWALPSAPLIPVSAFVPVPSCFSPYTSPVCLKPATVTPPAGVLTPLLQDSALLWHYGISVTAHEV